ncbi:protein LIKE EARLY STARVATION, chloroplastic isoform X2 [Cicer arietinum]|uniref:Uncharacterized protein LOC101501809 isoform X2 n=1 Tax=Cicer arietinum TaxID=3827 RepID=A0A3Q7X7K9_CICAR|nr:uncharacterized protein LOC101501809 isoform X2 [Cicer arietinum]
MSTHLIKTFLAGAPYKSVHLLDHKQQQQQSWNSRTRRWTKRNVRASSSYLDMWKKAIERERNTSLFNKIAYSNENDVVEENLEKKTEEFQKLLEVSSEERDRIQRLQVIDRASAAIAAARAILHDANSNTVRSEGDTPQQQRDSGSQNESIFVPKSETQNGSLFVQDSGTQKDGIPGPDFWSWTPPLDSDVPSDDANGLKLDTKSSVSPTFSNPVVEKERLTQSLSIPFESLLTQSKDFPTLPPLQSSLEVETSVSNVESPSLEDELKRSALSSDHAAEVIRALDKDSISSPIGVNLDGTKWWKETGIEQRPDGVMCRWTMTRGVSADQGLEWQEKFWEASDEFGYKELGSEKSGRDAYGNIWREFWRESMRQENGLMHFEKTADKWGKNGNGDEWHEKWWEHYDASGQAEKWADKWCSIDPNTPLEAGHAHVWHERWGETYDGKGGSTKYTDKWAERSGDGGWEKWGDKWDENFDLNGHGVKQGETWWEGKYGERWNRTWGEQHNGSGWVHKYGRSSSGEHWDTHEMQDTWYERFPHFGFFHCFENSVELREVQKPSEREEL